MTSVAGYIAGWCLQLEMPYFLLVVIVIAAGATGVAARHMLQSVVQEFLALLMQEGMHCSLITTIFVWDELCFISRRVVRDC